MARLLAKSVSGPRPEAAPGCPFRGLLSGQLAKSGLASSLAGRRRAVPMGARLIVARNSCGTDKYRWP
eukprot:976441-Rhodomonas_salina.2